MKKFVQMGKALSLITQLGLSIAAPIFLSVWGAGRLAKKLDLGNWVILLGILFGIGGAAASALKFYHYVINKEGGKEK